MKVIVFGLGSIGERHARLLVKRFGCDVYAFRTGKKSRNLPDISEIYSWKEAESLKARVAFITNPTSNHIETAQKCAKLGMHLFIEKPLSDSLKGISQLEKIVNAKRLVCYTAYCLRFHPVVKKIKELLKGRKIFHVRIACSSYLPAWRKTFNVKKTYSALKKKGGGVILDLSHEFDYIEFILGSITSIKGAFGRVSDITLDAEDFADILLKVKNRIPVNLHLNFLSRANERLIKIDFDGGYLQGDLIQNSLVYRNNGQEKSFSFSLTDDDLFESQTRYFLNNLGNPLLMNNLSEAKNLLKKIFAFKKKGAHD